MINKDKKQIVQDAKWRNKRKGIFMLEDIHTKVVQNQRHFKTEVDDDSYAKPRCDFHDTVADRQIFLAQRLSLKQGENDANAGADIQDDNKGIQ